MCTVAPIPGETKVWQYITLMKRIYLIDCPGVVPPSITDTPEDILLRGVVRVENVANPAQYVPAVLARTQTRHLERTYEIKYSEYEGDSIAFLAFLARKGGRLLKGGEPDVDGVAKMVLNDFLRGKIPWFSPPPGKERDGVKSGAAPTVVDGREGRLGEMPAKGTKRKREDVDEDTRKAEPGLDGVELGEDEEGHGGISGLHEVDERDTAETDQESDETGSQGSDLDRASLDEVGGEDDYVSLGGMEEQFESFDSGDDDEEASSAG